MTERCKTCGRELDVPKGDVVSRDCGGDCLLCMAAVFSDPDCIKSLGLVYAKALLDQPQF
jgi:hypothetical protein